MSGNTVTWQSGEEAGPCWISGLYKIRFYENLLGPFHRGKPGYAAYYIRKGDKNWGYHVSPHEPYYATLEEAQSACSAHWETVKDERWAQQIVVARAQIAHG